MDLLNSDTPTIKPPNQPTELKTLPRQSYSQTPSQPVSQPVSQPLNQPTELKTLPNQSLNPSNQQAASASQMPSQPLPPSTPVVESLNQASQSTIYLNESQTKAVQSLKRYATNEKHNKFLMLGPGGSGKTTCIINAFANTEYKIAFCAFTNKATQVLRQVAEKFNLLFSADFMTIHKLLMLEPRYFNHDTELAFKFDTNKIGYLQHYDIIIFDECSTISIELKKYIDETQEFIKFKSGKILKYIFIGDYWQLPPVGEESSTVFDAAIKDRWLVSKLSAVMRSANDKMQLLNQDLIKWANNFKAGIGIEKFHINYPYNLAKKSDLYTEYIDDFLDKYLTTWQTCGDTVILTYSRANCDKLNGAIQDKIDLDKKREIPDNRDHIKFYPGDRCCIDKPIEVHTVKRFSNNSEDYAMLDNETSVILYNGEIFDVISVENCNIITALNKFSYIAKHFPGQILRIARINDDTKTIFEVIHIDDHLINQTRVKIKNKERRMLYLNIFSCFTKLYPKLSYGYCITIYKSQGSEWQNVFVNLLSIRWSIIHSNEANIKKKKALFKATYTALSRASHTLTLYYTHI